VSCPHTNAASGAIFRNVDHFDSGNTYDQARDVAVIRTDTRVGVVPPIRPAGLTTPRCATEFDSGTVIGFGLRVAGFQANGVFDVRNFATEATDGSETSTRMALKPSSTTSIRSGTTERGRAIREARSSTERTSTSAASIASWR